MIVLYTPATGFPDLEIKIAYGLARVGIEAGYKPLIIPSGGFYVVKMEGEIEKLNKTFNRITKRILSSEYIPLNTPGITSRSAKTLKIKDSEYFDLEIFTKMVEIAEHKKSERFCRHNVKDKVSNVLGFTASATTGVLCKRDGLDITFYKGQPRRPTEPRYICKTCALLSLLGIWYTSFVFSIADKEVMIIPVPNQEISGFKLQEIFAIQHQIRKERFNQNIPQILIPLVFLSKIPSSADILDGFDLFIAILSRQQGYHVDGLYLIPIKNYLHFIKETPYNIATIDVMLRKEAYSSLQELNNAIYNREKASLPKFARLYVQETSSFLYPETAKYLLKEVTMIDSKIIENPALNSLARTLRYFIREQKYSYADDIRNARKESRDFEDTIAKMLREGRLRLEQKEKIHLPTDEEIKEIFRLANQDFEATKTALVILAFSFPSKVEETIEIKEEV
ncbi:type I-A CRISPR-associated protein Csa5 [Candidatus Pacearchaeota archaeon]|nr:MAG: type I-A CRISPR-associated protein Csa5 [Candidatus Pacearchaeota archaeon]